MTAGPGALAWPVEGHVTALSSRQRLTVGRCPRHVAPRPCLQTDALIQRTIRRVFAERSTLTIAHRLDTIIFSDKILAMAQGQVRARAGGGCTARAGRA